MYFEEPKVGMRARGVLNLVLLKRSLEMYCRDMSDVTGLISLGSNLFPTSPALTNLTKL
jgi:hypothetical protein